MSRRSILLRLIAFYTASFAALGIHLLFFPLWLEDRGLGEAQLGYVLGSVILARTVAGPLWAQYVDRSGRRVATLRLLACGSLLAYLPFAGMEAPWAYAAVGVAFGVFYPPIHSLLDHLATSLGTRHGFAYGPVRLWGSLAFLLAAVLGGAALHERDPEPVYAMAVGCLAATALAGWFLPGGDSRPAGPRRRPVRELLGQGHVLLFLAAVGLIQSSHAAFYGFSAVHWKRAGIGEAVIGGLWAEGVLAEILLFACSTRLPARVRPVTLLAIGGAGAALRWVVLANTTAVPALAAVQWLHALSFGCTHLGAVHFIARSIPDGLQASAQSLMGAVAMGAAMALSTMAAGEIYKARGGDVFATMAVLALLGAAAALLLGRRLAQAAATAPGRRSAGG